MTASRGIALLLIIALLPTPLGAQTIAAGNLIPIRLDHEITTKTARPGDPIRARISEDLKVAREVVIPAGTPISGRVDYIQTKTVTQDGWVRLLFNRIDIDGRQIQILATGAFEMERKRGKGARVLTVLGLGAVGAVIGGKTKRVAGGLGGAIVGIVLFENRTRYGKDLTLPAGKVLEVKLSGDLAR